MTNDMDCIPDSCSMLFPMIMLPRIPPPRPLTTHADTAKGKQREKSVLIKCLFLSLFSLLIIKQIRSKKKNALVNKRKSHQCSVRKICGRG